MNRRSETGRSSRRPAFSGQVRLWHLTTRSSVPVPKKFGCARMGRPSGAIVSAVALPMLVAAPTVVAVAAVHATSVHRLTR